MISNGMYRWTLPDIWPVLIQPHVPNKEYLPIVNKPGEGTVHCKNNPFSSLVLDPPTFLAPRSHPSPVTKVALSCVVSLQHVAIPALNTRNLIFLMTALLPFYLKY